jgi:hypothetical protein
MSKRTERRDARRVVKSFMTAPVATEREEAQQVARALSERPAGYGTDVTLDPRSNPRVSDVTLRPPMLTAACWKGEHALCERSHGPYGNLMKGVEVRCECPDGEHVWRPH